MIQMGTILEVADNSGARRIACIRMRGGASGRYAHLGDVVRIIECRPISKLKRWRLGDIVRKAVQVAVEPASVDLDATVVVPGVTPSTSRRTSPNMPKGGRNKS